MSFALGGTHRTGKSTLAQIVADRLDLPFLRTDVAGVWARLGLDSTARYSFEDRMKIQYEILEHIREVYSRDRVFVTDRTPLCLMMYTLGDIAQSSGWDMSVLEDYQNACYEMTNRHLSHIFVLQPGIQVEAAQNKGNTDPAYTEKLNVLFKGVAVDHRNSVALYQMNREVTDLEERVGYICSIIQQAQAHFSQLKEWDTLRLH